MLSFGNKEFRNLQEQVLQNAKDIAALKGIKSLQVVIVEELPEVGNPNYIYLIAKDDGESPDVYDEYIWLADEERYEKIGGVSIDLTHYVTTDTEQTITGAKTFEEPSKMDSIVAPSSKNFIIYRNDGTTPAFIIGNYDGTTKSNYTIVPRITNFIDLGTSGFQWRDLYLSGTAYISTLENASAISFKINGVERFKLTGADAITGRLYPSASNTFDLGTASLYYRNLYLTGNISDGANTVSVANIASKATSAYASGTFDTNGEDTIDISDGTPEGLFIFDCGNCQTMLHLTATMVQNAELTPIYIPAMYIYNGSPAAGWLKISKSGNTLTLYLGGGLTHVDSGYAWTLTKTNLL